MNVRLFIRILWNVRNITPQPLYSTVFESDLKTLLAKQPSYIQTKLCRLYREMTINGHFLYILYIFRMYRLYRKDHHLWSFIYIIYNFWDPSLTLLYPKLCNNEPCYKEVVVYMENIFFEFFFFFC